MTDKMELWIVTLNGREYAGIFGSSAADAIARFTRQQGGRIFGKATARKQA